MSQDVVYSAVVPARNESKNIPILVERLHQVLIGLGKSFEIIIVNDNSKDDSKVVLESLKARYAALKPIHRIINPGAGNTIREGLAAARGEIIITLDGDLSHDPAEIPSLLEGLSRADMVCGSRYTQGGAADLSISRRILSGIFNWFFRTLIGLPVNDFTSGFRVYKRKVIDTVRLQRQQFGIFVEVPIKAYLAGFKLIELPITYHKRIYGTTNLNYVKQAPEYLGVVFDALLIRAGLIK